MTTTYQKINRIQIDGNRYYISYRTDGEINFYRIVREVTEDFEVVDMFDDDILGDTPNALRVIRRAAEEITTWILRTKPHYACFEANDPRKRRIYERLFKKHIEKIPDYHYAYDDGKYHLYRKC